MSRPDELFTCDHGAVRGAGRSAQPLGHRSDPRRPAGSTARGAHYRPQGGGESLDDQLDALLRSLEDGPGELSQTPDTEPTPLDFANRYAAMRPFAGGPTLRVTAYLQLEDKPVQAGAAAGATRPAEESRLGAAMRLERRDGADPMEELLGRTAIEGTDLRQAFNGKATPEQLIRVLRLAVRAGRTSVGRLQSYVDEHGFGADCSGFVNAYFRTLFGDRFRPRNIRGFAGRDALRRSRSDEIRPRDIYAFTSAGGEIYSHPDAHIGLVHAASGNGFTGVESASSFGGIGPMEYTLHGAPNDGVFHLDSHRPRSQHRWVYIARVEP